MLLSEYVGWLALFALFLALLILCVPVVYRRFNLTWEPWLFKRYSISPDLGVNLIGVAIGLGVLSYVIGSFF